MVRTKPDVDVESFTTDRLVDFINDTAPTAADLPDDAPAADQITANVEAAIDELRSRRNVVATDGGTVDEPTVEDAADDEWVGYLEPDTGDVKIRHDQSIRTKVVDGDVVHEVVEDYDDEADRDSLGFTGGYTCPDPDHDISTEYDGDVIRHTCDDDECPFAATVAYRPTPEGEPNHKTPSWYRVTVPHEAVFEHGTDDDFDPDEWVDDADADADDKSDVAGITRRLALSRFVVGVRDAAYVSSEYDGDPVEDDDAEKVADAYIDTFECARCGDEHDVGAERSHPNHDDPVCRECEDDHVWGFDDADLPDDVEAVFDDYKSVTPAKFRDLLRDVKYWPAFIVSGDDDKTVDDAPACPTGKGAKRTVTQGPGGSSKGSGFRRADDGACHGDRHFRTVIREARDAGLIERVDDEDDVDFDDPAARWKTTDKGDKVFDELARCVWCGGKREAVRHKYTVKLSRWNTATNFDLTTKCPCGCREDFRGTTTTLSEAE